MIGEAFLDVGDVVQAAEHYYCDGLVALTLRITKVHGLLYRDDGPWVIVDGIPLWPDGYEGEERYAQIRVAGIQHVQRQPE